MSKRIATRLLAVPLVAVTVLLVVACAANKPAPTAVQAEAIELIEAGRLEVAAERFEQAEQVLESALTAPGFSDLSAADQVYAYWFASFAAAARKDHVLAHQRMVAATAHAEAGAEQWMVRAQWAAVADEWGDGASAIATVAERWPARLRTDAARELVPHITSSVRREGANPQLYLKLVDALFDAEFTLDFDIQPDYWWLQLLLDALHRDDLARATAIAARIETTDTVLRMRIDRRFDAVVALDPERFDIDATARRQTAAMAKAMADRPRSLEAFVQYSYALFDEGRHDEVLAMCDGILAAVASASSPLFDDLDESLNWVYNHKAAALRARGQWDEALAVMEVGRKALEKGGVNVSQTINLATHYNDAGRPQQALDNIQGLDCGDAVSPYGCLLLYVVRYRAHLQFGNRAEAQKAFDYVGEHRAVSDETWLQVVLESGDVDAAAQLLIDQLGDPDTRGTALVNAQRYLPLPMTPIMQQAHQRKLRVLARADVAAVIEKVGRRGTVPLYRTPS
jgi:tetratricopeptide (TPR) repeat protein